jgi:hypothetical protein
MAEANVRFKDFSLDRPAIKFRIGNENFDAVPAVSIVLMQDVAKVLTKFSDDEEGVNASNMAEVFDSISMLCDRLLEPESAERFKVLLPRLDLMAQIIPLFMWLLEAYGLRPTQASSPSSDSSPTESDGTTSEAGASS